MIEINLTNGGIALIDDADFDMISKYKWRHVNQRRNIYATTNIKQGDKYVTVIMHRLIMGAQQGQMIDHIDCNGLNNQRNNLRLADYKQNSHNRRPNKGRKYKGVKKNGKHGFYASISINGKPIYLGIFSREDDAALAYNEAAIRYYGDYARLNVIERLPIYYRLMMI